MAFILSIYYQCHTLFQAFPKFCTVSNTPYKGDNFSDAYVMRVAYLCRFHVNHMKYCVCYFLATQRSGQK